MMTPTSPETSTDKPFPPDLQLLRCQARPLGDLAKDPQRVTTAVRPGGVAGEPLVRHVRIVLELTGWLYGVDPWPRRTPGEFCGKLGREAGTVDQSGEVHMVHHDLRTVVRPVAGREEVTYGEVRGRAVEERAVIERFSHMPSFAFVGGREDAARPGACRVQGALRLLERNRTAPIDVPSNDNVRHRLSRTGNRQINRTPHIMATVQLRNPTEGRAHYDRKKAAGKTSMEAMRSLERRFSDIVYQQLLADALRPLGASLGGQPGTTLRSSAAGLTPRSTLRINQVPEPANDDPRTTHPSLLTQRGAMRVGCATVRWGSASCSRTGSWVGNLSVWADGDAGAASVSGLCEVVTLVEIFEQGRAGRRPAEELACRFVRYDDVHSGEGERGEVRRVDASRREVEV